jgi:hypothetical protein
MRMFIFQNFQPQYQRKIIENIVHTQPWTSKEERGKNYVHYASGKKSKMHNPEI